MLEYGSFVLLGVTHCRFVSEDCCGGLSLGARKEETMIMVRRVLCGLMVTLTVFGFWTTVSAAERQPDARFVATPQEVVNEMLKMARVTKSDVVYDLGCGDGRIVITAAKVYSARGVGVDIDPIRIKESNENAVKAGVMDRVKFLQQDLFETNFSEATVVTLYLLLDMNLRLRPKLFRELKPGTRVLSHEFGMGDWNPDNRGIVRNVRIDYQPNIPDVKNTHFYFWMIPANVAGEWQWTLSGPRGRRDYTLHLVQKFQEFSGKVTAGGHESPIRKGRLAGDHLSFTVNEKIDGKNVTMGFSGRVDGLSIQGVVEIQGGPSSGKYPWTATRRP